MIKKNRNIIITILSVIMMASFVFMGAFMYAKTTVWAAGVPTPTTTYSITQTGTISADKWGGIALLSTSKTKIKNGDTYYIGYKVDSATTTMTSSVLQGVLLTSYSGSRVHVDLTTAGGAGIHRGTFYSEEKNFLEPGASYVIAITLTESTETAGTMSVSATVEKTTESGLTSYGMWEQRGSITGAGAKEYSVGLWLSMAAYTCENLAISNFYIMDANGNDLGVKNVVESGNTINLSISAEKVGATFKKADGTQLGQLTQVVELGTQITLPAGVSDGFICWKDADGNMYKAGDKVNVNAAISFTEVCTVVANKTYAVIQNGDVITNNVGGFNLMSKTKKTFEVGETVYMGYTVKDVSVDFSSVSSPTHGIIFTNNDSSRTHTDLTIASWYNAETQPSAKAGIRPNVAYSAANNLIEKGATYRIAITLVQATDGYAIERQIIKINDQGITTINLTDYTRWFTSIEEAAGLDYYFGIILNLSGATQLPYYNIAMTDVFMADDTGADLGVVARSDVGETITLNIAEQPKTINVTYKDVNGEVISDYSGEKPFEPFVVQEGVSDGFVCWKAGDLTYKPGDTILTLTDIELKEVCVDIALTDGASIRLSDPTGLRFRALMEKDVQDALLATFGEENIVSGILILPTDYLVSGVEFTIDGLNAKSIKYKNIVNDGANSIIEVKGVEYYAYYASLVNILAQNLTREFSARAYITIKLNDTESITIYSDYNIENNSRSVYDVACTMYQTAGVLNEVNTPILQGFINAVITVTGDTDGFTISLPSNYTESPYNVSNDGNKVIFTAKDGFDISKVKLININGNNYVGFTAIEGQIIITLA